MICSSVARFMGEIIGRKEKIYRQEDVQDLSFLIQSRSFAKKLHKALLPPCQVSSN